MWAPLLHPILARVAVRVPHLVSGAVLQNNQQNETLNKVPMFQVLFPSLSLNRFTNGLTFWIPQKRSFQPVPNIPTQREQ
jgi:hypothetical protein